MARKPQLTTHPALDFDAALAVDAEAFAALHEQQEQVARSQALELQAQACDSAADACWYLARSLGAARDLPPGEASLELLFQLIGALADLPAEVALAPLPEINGADDNGIGALCHQLDLARETAQDALVDAQLAAPRTLLCH